MTACRVWWVAAMGAAWWKQAVGTEFISSTTASVAHWLLLEGKTVRSFRAEVLLYYLLAHNS